MQAELDGEKLSWRVPLRGSGDSALAATAWAELYSKRLLALEDERRHRMVVALSQKFHLANRAASFLILDREEDYKAFDLAEEAVDLAELEKLRIREEDQRLDRLQGVALDEASDLARAVVSKLAELARGSSPEIRSELFGRIRRSSRSIRRARRPRASPATRGEARRGITRSSSRASSQDTAPRPRSQPPTTTRGC